MQTWCCMEIFFSRINIIETDSGGVPKLIKNYLLEAIKYISYTYKELLSSFCSTVPSPPFTHILSLFMLWSLS